MELYFAFNCNISWNYILHLQSNYKSDKSHFEKKGHTIWRQTWNIILGISLQSTPLLINSKLHPDHVPCGRSIMCIIAYFEFLLYCVTFHNQISIWIQYNIIRINSYLITKFPFLTISFWSHKNNKLMTAACTH